ncbi:lipoprotein [Vibrio sp. qd031]|uniref:COG3014 family protein n=1 Tax=Vibrio sp. qd031 TaxID=1603038 RepID=UPI000A101853|nr:hypothetical protein [Vibrio sp. qd031]ORT50136.1 lipoprotein [Vibrio sp. qd031]
MSWKCKTLPRNLGIVLLTTVVVGCSSLSVSRLFSHYSAGNAPARAALATGDYSSALSMTGLDEPLLSELEKGRIELLSQQTEQSQEQFDLAYRYITELEEQAVISISGSATSLGALALNDNITEYLPPDYEIGYLHLYSALNYVQKQDLEGALIEMRRANRVQERALANREASLKRAEEELKQSGVDPNLGSVMSRYPDAGDSLKAIQNSYLFYISALLFEADGDINAAYIDISRALAVNDANPEIIGAAIRIGAKFGARDEVDALQRQYGERLANRAAIDRLVSDSQQGRVIVINEVGVVQPMKEWRITIPVYDSRNNTAFYSLALPYYDQGTVVKGLPIVLDDTELTTNNLTDVNLMARQSLTEQMPTILVRQTLRAITKDRIRKEATNGDDVGNALFNVFNTLTEQPDTRSWQSLPATVHSATAMLTEGEHQVKVGEQTLMFNVRAGQTTLVWLSQQGNNASMWSTNLGRL